MPAAEITETVPAGRFTMLALEGPDACRKSDRNGHTGGGDEAASYGMPSAGSEDGYSGRCPCWGSTAFLHPPTIPFRQILRSLSPLPDGPAQHHMKREHRLFLPTRHRGGRKSRKLNQLVGIMLSDSTNIVSLRAAFAQSWSIWPAAGLQHHGTVRQQPHPADRNLSMQRLRRTFRWGGFTDLRPSLSMHKPCIPCLRCDLPDRRRRPGTEQISFPTLWVLPRKGQNRPLGWNTGIQYEHLTTLICT